MARADSVIWADTLYNNNPMFYLPADSHLILPMSISNETKVSVILTFRNAEQFLQESIASVLRQTLSDFELLVIDDASDDNSGAVVSNFLKDARIIYLKNEVRRGKSYNLNH